MHSITETCQASENGPINIFNNNDRPEAFIKIFMVDDIGIHPGIDEVAALFIW